MATPFVVETADNTEASADLIGQRQQHAQRMQTFGHLAGGVAHDFNNLLTVILGYTEILIAHTDRAHPAQESLAEIHKAGQRAAALTRQILAFSRTQKPEMTVLDLNAVVSDTEKMLRRLIGADILVTTLFSSSLNPVKADAGQIHQVILNLAVNARDAMPTGGRLTIETNNVTLDTRDFVMLAVSDTGIGMCEATLEQIFEPSFTTKSPGRGTGMGLAIVQRIVREAGGHIEVSSKPGHGSAFRIFLPAAQSDAPVDEPAPSIRMMPRGIETVLVVEDEQPVRTLICHVLRTCGYNVLEASAGDEAALLAERYGGTIHLVVAMWSCPGSRGHGSSKCLSKRTRS